MAEASQKATNEAHQNGARLIVRSRRPQDVDALRRDTRQKLKTPQEIRAALEG